MTNHNGAWPRQAKAVRSSMLGPLIGLASGALVAIVIWLLARHTASEHSDYGHDALRLFFGSTFYLKAWFATAALVVAVAQPITAAWLFRKLPWRPPHGLGLMHRAVGWLVVALTLPVAYLCVFEVGFYSSPGRVLAHSILGCALYGAFTAKVVVVRVRRSPPWAYVVTGSLTFALLLAVWWASAFWLFRTAGVSL